MEKPLNLPVSEVKYFGAQFCHSSLVEQRMLKYVKAIDNYHVRQTRCSEFQCIKKIISTEFLKNLLRI